MQCSNDNPTLGLTATGASVPRCGECRDKSVELRRRSVLLLLIMLTRGAQGSRSQICIWWVFLEIYSSQNIQYLFYSIFCGWCTVNCRGAVGMLALGRLAIKFMYSWTHTSYYSHCPYHNYLCSSFVFMSGHNITSRHFLNTKCLMMASCLIFTGHDIARHIPMQMFDFNIWYLILFLVDFPCWFRWILCFSFTNCRHD